MNEFNVAWAKETKDVNQEDKIMKIKICELGILWIFRKNKFKKAICPYTRGACSDDCALSLNLFLHT